jgi:hypothetical protein
MPLNHLRAMHAIEVCRTASLGGHRYKYSCGHVDISYNSCRNRHCPKCQTLQKEKWIEARCEDLLPIEYFHVVFTIPSELNPLVIMNQKVMYNILFRSVSETLTELSNNPKHLGARMGFIGILHTSFRNFADGMTLIRTTSALLMNADRWNWPETQEPIRLFALQLVRRGPYQLKHFTQNAGQGSKLLKFKPMRIRCKNTAR